MSKKSTVPPASHPLASDPLRIETDRLVIRAIDDNDLGAFHAIAGRREIARMLASVPHPLSLDAAREWIAARAYRGQPGFTAGIYRRDGGLIGCISLVNQPITVNYFLGPEHWGRGYATEALVSFLDWCAKQFHLTEIRAGALHDNLGSHRVLEKAGFRLTHVTQHQPPIRSEPDRLFMYWKGFGAPEPLAIISERLFIHPIHAAHAARLSQIGDDPLVAEMLVDIELPFTPEQARMWITGEEDVPDLHRLAITSKEGYLIGACELRITRKSGSMTGWISREQRSNGYGREAASCLTTLAFTRWSKLERLECSVMDNNTAAISILDNLGYERVSECDAGLLARKFETHKCLFQMTRVRFELAMRDQPTKSHADCPYR